jgi:lysophospholipase L1-like esterase
MRSCCLLLLCTTLLHAQDVTKFEKWEKAIAALEAQDAKSPPPSNAVLFAGSSSIRLWDLKKSFSDLATINRGFGGSQIVDSTHFAPRLIHKQKPHTIVFYAGDNDLASGKSPAQVAADFKAFASAVHQELPRARIIFIAIKPSVARAKLFDKQKEANALIESFCKQDERLKYLDVVTPMLTDGQPRAELFVKDGLHLNPMGYELWTKLLQPHLERKEPAP